MFSWNLFNPWQSPYHLSLYVVAYHYLAPVQSSSPLATSLALSGQIRPSCYWVSFSPSSTKADVSLPFLLLCCTFCRLCRFYEIWRSTSVALKELLDCSPHRRTNVPHRRTSAHTDSFVPRTFLEWNRQSILLVSISSLGINNYFCVSVLRLHFTNIFIF